MRRVRMRVIFDLLVDDEVEIDTIQLANPEEELVVVVGDGRYLTKAVVDYETVGLEEESLLSVVSR